MKKYDIVKLVELNEDLKKKNLRVGLHGVVLSANFDNSVVAFFNDENLGENLTVQVDNKFLKKENVTLPQKIIDILVSNPNKLFANDKALTTRIFNETDCVELVVEKEEYSKHNIHKGEIGVIASGEMINNKMLVDFTGVDKDVKISGEIISVDVNDLKLKKRPK